MPVADLGILSNMTALRLLREVVLILGLVAFGLFCLPAMIFFVGQQLVGDYEAGLGGLYEEIAFALVRGNGYAWLLILSPYFCVQLGRLWLWLHRQRKLVN
jgi:hypothetical protein